MFTNKGKSSDSMVPTPEPQVSTTKRAPARLMTSIIANGVTIRGAIDAEGAELQVDGEIDGNVRAGSLTIGDTGLVKGDVVSESVLVNGRVEGSVRARKVQLAKNAHVQGDITHQSLAVEMGAVFEGQCRYLQDPLKAEAIASSAPSPQIAPPTISGGSNHGPEDPMVGGVVVTQ
jgi:cytoskeletal protein CcmA (bactofilin family)